MQKRTRTFLFVLVGLAFISSIPLILLYSQGYRFDFKNRKFIQTGAFAFNVEPRGGWVEINGEKKEKTGIISREVYVGNLVPGDYNVEVKQAGYLPWTKNLTIQGSSTTENKNIFLVPERPQFNTLEKEAEDFFVSPDWKKAIIKKNAAEGWFLSLADIPVGGSSFLFDEKSFSKTKVNFSGLEWSKDSKRFLLKTEGKEDKYFIIETDGEKNLVTLNFPKGKIDEIFFSPTDSQTILFSQNITGKNYLSSLNYKNGGANIPLLNGFISVQTLDSTLFWLDDKGFLKESDLSGREIRIINNKTLAVNATSKYELFLFPGDKIFIIQDNNLYSFNRETNSLENISDNVKGLVICPDENKIAYFTENEILVLFLKDNKNQPQKKEGEKVTVNVSSATINNIFWLTNHYLIFSTASRVRITEIDDRDKINVYDFFTAKPTKLFWNKFDKKSYILSQDNVLVSQSLD